MPSCYNQRAPHVCHLEQVIEAGANAIVSGSGVFGAKDYAAAIKVGAALNFWPPLMPLQL